MKTFKDICKLSQNELKAYMSKYIGSKGYKVINEDGFLYAKGDVPVLLVAHLDTVHKDICKEIVDVDGKISSPQGIGGDDRCGVFIIMNVIKDLKCSVLLCEDEEIGLVGAKKFTQTEYVNDLDVNYMIELDRKGNNDAVFYSCDNKEFKDFVIDATGYKEQNGSCSDISKLMPAAGLSAVNLSCGYYNAHTTKEYVVYDEMIDAIDAVTALVKAECNEPFEYIERKYVAPTYTAGYNYYNSMFDGYNSYGTRNLSKVAIKDKEIELEVIVNRIDEDGYEDEQALYASGNTKAECWMEFFIEHSDICFADVLDYNWS